MQTIALTPRGYCHGVVHAIKTLKQIARDDSIKRPITVLGMVVHNQKIVDDFKSLGIITLDSAGKTRLELLDSVNEGTVVFTAHGVSEDVKEKAFKKGLTLIDTTCKDVVLSQQTVKNYLHQGYDVLFIGKPSHPEVETVKSYSDTKIHIITKLEDIKTLSVKNTKIALTNQTTMSMFDIYTLTEALKQKFTTLEVIEDLCDATKTRQLAVMHQKPVDHCFVVGDKQSNNSNKLVSVSQKRGIPSTLIESVEDLTIDTLKQYTKVSVTSGASTPSALTKEVIDFLTQFDKDDPTTHTNKSNVLSKNLFT